MSRFGPDPVAFFTDVYRAPAPWDVGRAQPDLEALLDAHPPRGPVLDVGCGTGDLAIALAGRGLDVVGVDVAEAAVEQARRRARSLPPGAAARVRFEVGDALRPTRLGERFGAVVDSGFLHLFDPADRDAFIRELAAVLRPGGRFYLLAFGITFPQPNSPLEVTEEEVRARFCDADGWRVREVRPATFHSRVAPVPALAACVERVADRPRFATAGAAHTEPEPLQGLTLSASLTVRDLQKSVSWYRDVAGFTVDREHERDGVVRAVSLRAGDVRILIGQDDGARGSDRERGEGFSLMVTTAQDLDEMARRIEARGGVLEAAPTTTPWGVRMFRLQDPDGFRFVISSPQ